MLGTPSTGLLVCSKHRTEMFVAFCNSVTWDLSGKRISLWVVMFNGLFCASEAKAVLSETVQMFSKIPSLYCLYSAYFDVILLREDLLLLKVSGISHGLHGYQLIIHNQYSYYEDNLIKKKIMLGWTVDIFDMCWHCYSLCFGINHSSHL